MRACVRKCLKIISISDYHMRKLTYLESEFEHSSRAVQASGKFNRTSEIAGGDCTEGFVEVKVLKNTKKRNS
jgi:hypothetical protein